MGEVLKVMRGLAEEGRTMLVMTHEVGFARDVSSKVVFRHGGRVGLDLPPTEASGAGMAEGFERFLSATRP